MQPHQASVIWPLPALAVVLLALAGCASSPPPTSPRAPAQDQLPLDVDRRNGNCHIQLTGPLDDEAVRSLRYVMTALEPAGCRSKRVLLDLQGGRVGSAITLGALIKNRGYDTQVQPGTTCLTPCLLAFAAGRQRILLPSVPPTRIGFSQIPPDADFGHQVCETELAASQAQALTRYLRAMLPVPTATAVYQKLTAATCQRTDYLGPAEALALGLATTTR
jgi:hypothetical protein